MKISGSRSRIGLNVAVTNLHALITERTLHPWDHRVPEYIDQQVMVCWEIAQAVNRSPHLCPDRYCACHWELSSGEPPRLPGL